MFKHLGVNKHCEINPPNYAYEFIVIICNANANQYDRHLAFERTFLSLLKFFSVTCVLQAHNLIKMSDKDLREKTLRESELVAQKQRFALFSQPLPIGLGDDSYDHKELHPRDENGKPITAPSNIKIAAPKQGKVKSSYFSVKGFVTIGDPYVDNYRSELQDELQKTKKIINEQPFKTIGYRELLGGPCPHMPEMDHKKTKNYKTADGRVYSAPKNITTNPEARQLFKWRSHMKDEYDRFEVAERRRKYEAKLKEKEQAFKSMIAGGENFNKDKQVFGLDITLPPKVPKETKLNILKQDAPFKPSNPQKAGFEGQFTKLVYIPEKETKISRPQTTKGKEAFKPNNLGTLSRPTPTISCFKTNIRRMMSAHR